VECEKAVERFQKNVVLEEQKRVEAEGAPILEKFQPQHWRNLRNGMDFSNFFFFKTFRSEGITEILVLKVFPEVRYEFKEDELDNQDRVKVAIM